MARYWAIGAGIAIVVAIVIGVFSMYGNFDTSDFQADQKDSMAEQAQKVVADAIALYDQLGTQAFEVITAESTNLQKGQLYPFVLDPVDITVVAHGAEPDRVGTTSVSLTESDRPYEQILEELKSNKGTWVEYRYVNPDTGQEQIKKTWLFLHDGYIFGSGYYLPS
jgi:hypothetical protein